MSAHKTELLPIAFDAQSYAERTDRNIGWISKEEQRKVHGTVIAIAGCGGMGGLLAQVFLRLGVGEIRIADSEVFDKSNLNRQFGATKSTLGTSKAETTARMLREICDDTKIIACTEGVHEDNVVEFLNGADVVCDEIEFWAMGSRVLLHQNARQQGIPIFNCNTVGCATTLFRFNPEDPPIEKWLGFSLEEAYQFERAILDRTIDAASAKKGMDALLSVLVPEMPPYATELFHQRLAEENRASILATNPPFATGFLADHVLLHLLRSWGSERDALQLPAAPGYLFVDAWNGRFDVVAR